MRGDLSSTGVAIAVHRAAALARPRKVLVTTTPVKISTVAAMNGQIQDVPLVLTTSAFTYEQLAEIGMSTMERGLSYMWGHVDKVLFDPKVSALLQQLLHEDGDGHRSWPRVGILKDCAACSLLGRQRRWSLAAHPSRGSRSGS